MNNHISYYTNYRKHIQEYDVWNRANNIKKGNTSLHFGEINENSLKQKAKTISAPLLLQDSYEHEKAEDAETFYQTFNIELMSLAGVISSLPVAITKLSSVFEKYAKDGNFSEKAARLINQYKNISIKFLSKNIPFTTLLTGLFSLIGFNFYAHGIKKSMEAQLGLIRKASFDSTQSIINDPKLFAILTDEQEKEVDSIVNYENKHNSTFVDTLQDKVNLQSTFSSVKEYKITKKDYLKQKKEYNNSINNINNGRIYKPQETQANEDKVLFENLLKNVEHDVLEPLRRVETISNISYSSLFTGGFLEYLLTDKLVQILGIKNKAVALCVKIGVPLLTYLLLNKNISDIENKAILATKYKHLKQFVENPLKYENNKEEKKQSLPQFIKTVYKDIKEYERFSTNELPKIKQKLEAKREISLSENQERTAKNLQKNTAMVINKHREEVYNQTVGIKAFSESILGPIDIISTAIGATIGNYFAKSSNSKYSRLYKGLGAVIAFIPAAIIEAKLTKQQKLAEKIAAMNTVKNIQDPRLFLDNTKHQYTNIQTSDNYSEAFKQFQP